ncbi:choline/ethanolamine kinase family protein [Alteromonas gracilis]|uniref:choline/ethanolamine kinase family protein n=1 Tax=Alteromonas gracilis TaxID=1479524 RepID=UPI003219ABA7
MDTSIILGQLQRAFNLSKDAQLYRHPAGAVNHVYRLQDKQAYVDFAVKWLGDDDFSGVNRNHQFALQQQLYQQHIAPKPIWLSDDERIWIESWQPNTRVAQRNPETLANVLARIHQLPVTARPLDLSSRWQHYLISAEVSEDDALYAKAIKLKSSVLRSEQMHNDIVLCHNDLLFSHVLCRKEDTPVVIDWEYSAMGNRYFDLASCCLINDLSEATSYKLLECYVDILSLSHHEAREEFDVHKEIVHVTNALWFEALNRHSSQALTSTT